MQRLEELTIKEAKDFIPDNDVLNTIVTTGESVLRISGGVTLTEPKNDELVDLEIALRKCERLGVFRE